MRFILTLFLGLLYGLCEFLPVSGSGILYLIYSLSPSSVAVADVEILFCFLNLGLVLSSIIYFTLHRPFLPEPGRRKRKRRTGNLLQHLPKRLRPMLLVSMVPLFLLFFFTSVLLRVEKGALLGVAVAFAISAGFLLLSQRFSRGGKKENAVGVREALTIGVAQLCSVFPGLSRACMTLTAGLYCGLEYYFTLDYSILLSVPAYGGAAALMFVRASGLGLNWSLIPACFSAMLFSFAGGYLSITLVKKYLKPEHNRIFVLCSFGLAVLCLVLSLIH